MKNGKEVKYLTVTVKGTIVEPFPVPEHVTIVGKDHGTPGGTIPLKNLTAKSLDDLCTHFRDAVFNAACPDVEPRDECSDMSDQMIFKRSQR